MKGKEVAVVCGIAAGLSAITCIITRKFLQEENDNARKEMNDIIEDVTDAGCACPLMKEKIQRIVMDDPRGFQQIDKICINRCPFDEEESCSCECDNECVSGVKKRMRQIESLKDNWDGEGSKAPSKKVCDNVRKIAKLFEGTECYGGIFPTGRNSIQIEFCGKDTYFDIEVYEDRYITTLAQRTENGVFQDMFSDSMTAEPVAKKKRRDTNGNT